MYQEELLIVDFREIMWKLIQTIKTYRNAANCHSWQYSRMFIERSQKYCLFALALEKKMKVLDQDPDEILSTDDHPVNLSNSEISMDDFLSLIQRCKQSEYELLDKYNIMYYKSYIGGSLRDLITEQRDAIRSNLMKWTQYEAEVAQIAS